MSDGILRWRLFNTSSWYMWLTTSETVPLRHDTYILWLIDHCIFRQILSRTLDMSRGFTTALCLVLEPISVFLIKTASPVQLHSLQYPSLSEVWFLKGFLGRYSTRNGHITYLSPFSISTSYLIVNSHVVLSR